MVPSPLFSGGLGDRPRVNFNIEKNMDISMGMPWLFWGNLLQKLNIIQVQDTTPKQSQRAGRGQTRQDKGKGNEAEETAWEETRTKQAQKTVSAKVLLMGCR